MSAGAPDSGIWIYDLTRGSWDRLISGGVIGSPVWSGDGERLAFGSNRNGLIKPFWIPTDRSAPAEQLTRTDSWTFPLSCSRDGRTMLLLDQYPQTGRDISALSLDTGRVRRPFLHSLANEDAARFSPDDHWVAYESDESGRDEVYVTAYPGPGGRSQVSTDGGSSPVWSRDGRELFYRNRGKMMAAAAELQPMFHTGLPKPLFDSPNLGDYDVAPDGQRFVMIRTPEETAAPRSISVVLGWFDDLVRRVPTGKK